MFGVLLLSAAAVLDDCRWLELRGDAGAPACYRELADAAADPRQRAAALHRLGDVNGANAAYRDAVARQPDDADLRAGWGALFLDVHQEADAETLFQEALALDPDNVDALLGLASLSMGRFDAAVEAYLQRVRIRAPQEPGVGLLEARLALEAGELQAGRRILQRLLRRLPEDPATAGAAPEALAARLDAFALLAAADALQDVGDSPWTSRALALNPRFGDAHAVPARLLVINRRYLEAVARYRQAVAVAPTDWAAHAQLGINLLRVNRPADARRHLSTAYQGDPYNALTVNSLRLLDLLDDFANITRDGVLLRAPSSQAPLLLPTVLELSRRARAQMSERYGYRPAGDVVVELYEHHDDFAVRTVGLPGIGILGATFGDVLVMDGPAAKSIVEGFDWASALWHELAHVYTLGATDNRVSRWLSEGISVMEEWRHGPTPREAVPLHFIEALADDRLLPVDQLDDGFLRPDYPQQVAVSYVQAGLICALIADRHPGGLGRMLGVYRQGGDTVAAIRDGLGVAPAELDRALRARLDARFGTLLGELDAYRADLEAAHAALEQEDWATAERAGARAVDRYPAFVDAGSGYVPLARAQAALDLQTALHSTLQSYFERGGRDPWALERLADSAAGSATGLAALEALARTTPLDGAVRVRLGDRLVEAGHAERALQAYRAAIALEPHDLAPLYLRLARTYYGLGRPDEARQPLLQALEIAPRYGPALDLLLLLQAGDATNHGG